MSRLSTKLAGLFAGVVTVSGLATGVALADHAKVDGSITAQGETCSWTNASTSANPPNTLTVDRTTVNPPGGNLSCTGSTTATLNNDPTVTFDDANGTATADLIDVTIEKYGTQCRYKAHDVQAQRDGTTRHYTATTTIPLYSGGWLCPSEVTAESSFTFH